MGTTVEIPDIKFTGFYYFDVLQNLLLWSRADASELTDEDPNEPYIQILRAYALICHLSNVLIDHVARESMLPTAQLRRSVADQLKLIDYELSQPAPAVAEEVAKLTAPLTSTTTLAAGLLFATQATIDQPEIQYESLAEISLAASNVISHCWENDGGVYTDRTTEINNDGDTFDPWSGDPVAGDELYFGHEDVLWDTLLLTLDADGNIWDADDHVWEYYDGGVDDTNPNNVTDLGGGVLRMKINNLLGTNIRTGSQVTVRSLVTGASETVASEFTGTENYIDTSYLGQTTPSTDAADYVIGAEWKEVPDVVESVNGTERTTTWDLPETTQLQWRQTAVNGVALYWLRLRIVQSTPDDSPTFRKGQINQGDQWIKFDVTQGESVTDDPLGSSTGEASQQFQTSRDDLIDASATVYVDEGSGDVEYSEVSNFLSSTSQDRVYTLDYDDDGRGIPTFGDGTNGKIPPSGTDNISMTYRRGAANDGNVGADTIVVNKSGAAILASVTNPRPATGWTMADGATSEDLERVKIAGPASLRTRNRAVTAADYEDLIVDYADETGSKPVKRAKAVEEGYGPKTIQLLCVGAGGALLSDSTLDGVEDYFNGVPETDTPGIGIINIEATADNYTPRVIDVTATITGGDVDTVKAAVVDFLNPLKLKTDGTYQHDFGGLVSRERIIAVMFQADPDVEDVNMTVPASDITLLDDELPNAGTVSIS